MSAEPDSDSPSVDGNYVFTPPKEDTDHPDRPRLEPLDLGFRNDGTLPRKISSKSINVRHPPSILST